MVCGLFQPNEQYLRCLSSGASSPGWSSCQDDYINGLARVSSKLETYLQDATSIDHFRFLSELTELGPFHPASGLTMRVFLPLMIGLDELAELPLTFSGDMRGMRWSCVIEV